jgi:hypothetical protein
MKKIVTTLFVVACFSVSIIEAGKCDFDFDCVRGLKSEGLINNKVRVQK